MMVEKYLEKGKLFAAFIDLEKAYNTAQRKGLWDVLRIDNVDGCLLEGIKSFYKDVSPSVQVKEGLSESLSIDVGVK